MKIVIAPDSFKESLSASIACEAIERGIRKIFPDAQIISIPISDGGEGTVKNLVSATAGEIVKVSVHDPLMRKIESNYGILGDKETAVVEIATASGLELLKKEDRNPLLTSTYGTGELIKNALDRGCKKIIIGLGGSATNDGGAGMVMALGAKLLDRNGKEIQVGGVHLGQLNKIDLSSFDQRVKEVSFTVACDVSNPLLGERGASNVYGPQKGATPEMVKILDESLKHYAEVIESSVGISIANVPGAGAAGGLGAGLLAFMNAQLKPGFSIISELTKLEDSIMEADLIITAEGKTDRQTLNGKVPFGVGMLGKKHQIPVLLFTGKIDIGSEDLYKHGISSMVSICPGPVSLDFAIQNAETLLESAVERTFRILNIQK